MISITGEKEEPGRTKQGKGGRWGGAGDVIVERRAFE